MILGIQHKKYGFKDEMHYQDYKNAMLKSVYNKGGFYVGRYEVGTKTIRTANKVELEDPVIQRNTYPYNWVTCKQAQDVANQLASDQQTSSLMFGIQWDLVLKFIETKGAKTKAELKTNSSSWGNYENHSFNVSKGEYSIDNGKTFTKVEGLLEKTNLSQVLFTTGVTNRNSALNIYDLAGNIEEWTLEYTRTS